MHLPSVTNLGAHARSGTTAVQQVIRVQQVFAHEDFCYSHLKNDIALLKLATPATLSDKVNTVCLPEQGSRIAAGHQCYITGISHSIELKVDPLQSTTTPCSPYSLS